MGEPRGDSPNPGDSFGLDNIGGVLSEGLPGPLVRKGEAGASSSASMSSGGSRSLVMSARRLSDSGHFIIYNLKSNFCCFYSRFAESMNGLLDTLSS